MATRDTDSDRVAFAVLLLCLAVFVASRAFQLEADPPTGMFHGWSTLELVREPPAKAHEARNWALFGAFKLNDADNYQFWRSQAPAWVYPLAGTFRAFGTSYATLRGTAIAYVALGLVPMFTFLRRNTGHWWPGAAAILALSLDATAAVYDRAGFLEPAVAAWCMAAIDLLDRARTRPLLLVPAHVAFALALFTKQAAVVAAPVVAVATAVVLVRQADRRERLVVLAAGGALAVVALAWVLSTNYVHNMLWNFSNALRIGTAAEPPDSEIQLWTSARVVATVFAAPLALAVPFLAETALDPTRRRAIAWGPALVVGWWAATLAALLTLRAVSVRYPLVFFPPAYVLGALAAADAVATRSPVRRGLLALTLLGFVGFHGVERVRIAQSATWRLAGMRAFVHEHVRDPSSAVVVGALAAPAVLASDVRHFYVKEPFNSSPEALDALAPTHLLLLRGQRDFTRAAIRDARPAIERDAHVIASTRLHGRTLDLYETARGRAR